MSPSQIIVLATPVFFLLIAIELAVGYRRQRNTYRLADAVSSISLGMLSQTSAVFTRLLRMGDESAVLWAAHAVHHQSEDYNLSTALRQTSSGALLGWIFYVPMALA